MTVGKRLGSGFQPATGRIALGAAARERAGAVPATGAKDSVLPQGLADGVVGGMGVGLVGKGLFESELAASMLGVLGRQQPVDTKGFKGRGALRRLRNALANVDKVHQEMAQLVKLSTAVVGRAMYLCTHRRKPTEQVSLRWRASGVTGGHLSWSQVQGLIASYPLDLRDWYAQANQLVMQLNEREKLGRAALRKARLELVSQQPELGDHEMDSLL